MSSSDQEVLCEYLNQGGSVYIEGVDFAWDHHNTEFFNYFGTEYQHRQFGEVWELHGQDGTIAENLTFAYDGGTNSHTIVDAIGATTGSLLMICEQSKGRVTANSQAGYRTICSTIVIGAIHDGVGDITKANLMQRYIEFLENK